MQECLVHVIEVSLQVTAWVEVQLCYVTFINNIINIAKRKGLITLIWKQFVVFMDPGKYGVLGVTHYLYTAVTFSSFLETTTP